MNVTSEAFPPSKLDFIAFSFFIVMSTALAIIVYLFGGVDFGVYYAAARVTLAGGNPYDFQQLAPQIVASAGEINNPYYYAPWFTWLVMPFSFLLYPLARALWLAFNYLLWLWALFNLSSLIKYPQNGWRKWSVWLLVTFVFAWSTWGSEQVGILILLLFTLILIFAQRENWVVVGICLALVLFKPNVAVIPAGAISIWFIIHKKQWAPLLVMIGTVLFMLFIAFLVTPNWHLALFQPDKIQGLSYTLDSSGQTEIQRYTTTLLDWLKIYGVDGSLAISIYGIVTLFGIMAVVYGMLYFKSLVGFSALVILVSFAVIPYTLFYDYPSLVITLFCINSDFMTKPKYIWAQRAMNSLIFVSLFIGEDIRYRYWMVVILFMFSWFSGVFTAAKQDE